MPRSATNPIAVNTSKRLATTTGGSTPNHLPTASCVPAPGAVAGVGDWPSIADGGAVGLTSGEGLRLAVGVGVALGMGSPVVGSTIVKLAQRYSRMVSPESWIFAATSRPR